MDGELGFEVVRVVLARMGPQDSAGHWEKFHRSLAAALEEIGAKTTSFDLFGWSSGSGLTRGWLSRSRVVGLHLLKELNNEIKTARPDVVVCYEASLDFARWVAPVARENPKVLFLLNLFEHKETFDFPSNRSLRHKVANFLRHSDKSGNGFHDFSDVGNIQFTAEYQGRTFMARASGLQDVGVWPVFSPEVNETPAVESSSLKTNVFRLKQRCFVPVSGWQLTTPGAVDWTALLHCWMNPRVRRQWTFHVSGFGFPVWFLAMASLLRVHIDRLADREYLASMKGADLVWLPQGRLYRTQGSGKALDALMSSVPLLVRAGSVSHTEVARWCPGYPAYQSPSTAAELLSMAPHWRRHARATLAQKNPKIASFYSPRNAARRLIETIRRARFRASSGLNVNSEA